MSDFTSFDPHFAREKARYTHPIASRDYICTLIKQSDTPLTLKKLADITGIVQDQQRHALHKRLQAMAIEGQIVYTKHGTWQLPRDIYIGRVRSKKDGSGIFIPENNMPPMSLSPIQMRRVFDGDRVRACAYSHTNESQLDAQCVITEIVQRNTSQVTGYFYTRNGKEYVVPRNKRFHHHIFVDTSHSFIPEGSIVEVKITTQPARCQRPFGNIVRVFTQSAIEQEIDIALCTHNLRTKWNNNIVQELAHIQDFTYSPTQDDRQDLRELAFVTIDGEDSKDFDDAVFCTNTHDGWKLFVAVSDVSLYVYPDSALDTEALARGTSVYFAREAIPMLPEKLSNDLCSLKPQCDRPVIVCEIHINRNGIHKDFIVYQALIRSHARLSYQQVNTWLAHAQDNIHSTHVTKNLTQFALCYAQLAQQRELRGALSIEIPETHIEFAPNGKVQAIYAKQRGNAHKMIEEAMVLANSLVAQLLASYEMPVPYRVHAQPETTKIHALQKLLQHTTGLTLCNDEQPQTHHFNTIITKLTHNTIGTYLLPLVIRTMPQALYSTKNIGHYGLALSHYCHFTSPIRRYPDLLVHRALKALMATAKVRNHLPKHAIKNLSLHNVYPYDVPTMQMICVQCSAAEQSATQAGFDVHNHLCCQYFAQYIGKTFCGTIRSVTNFGLFVEIGSTNVDGLVHVSNLPNDYYHFHADAMYLYGERNKKRFHIGDQLQVTIAHVDTEHKKIDLRLVRQ